MNLLEYLKSLARKSVRDGTPASAPAPETSAPETSALDTLNIETSYACNLRCVMCPRHFEGADQGVLSMDLFRERIAPELKRFRYLHLTGWGEPLMHPEFAEIVRVSKAAGCWVCFTSNGLLLKEPLTRELLEADIDLVNVSIDGATPETYESVRGKGTFTRAIERLRAFHALRRSVNKTPALQWTFVMMRSTIAELPAAVALAAEVGCDRFIAKHMETALTREDLADALFETGVGDPPAPEDEARFDALVAEARAVADRTAIALDVHPRRFGLEATCLARPLRTLFVDWQGYVSPCCYLNRLDMKPYIADPPKEDGVLGTLTEKPLDDWLDAPAYRAFHDAWRRGTIPEACRGCLQVQRMHAKE